MINYHLLSIKMSVEITNGRKYGRNSTYKN